MNKCFSIVSLKIKLDVNDVAIALALVMQLTPHTIQIQPRRQLRDMHDAIPRRSHRLGREACNIAPPKRVWR
jgi:hypothetical protein